jgi:hypothetical protein
MPDQRTIKGNVIDNKGSAWGMHTSCMLSRMGKQHDRKIKLMWADVINSNNMIVEKYRITRIM